MAVSTNVLTMEDDPVVRETIAAYLIDEGYSVTQAESGLQGLALIKEKNIDAILLDWRLPDISGGEVLSRLAKMNPTIPVIVVSGTDEVEEVIEALQRGAWDYLRKPLKNMDILIEAIVRNLNRARMMKEAALEGEHLKELVRSRTEELERANALLRREAKERQEYAAALKESEARFRQLVETVREAFFVRNAITKEFIYVSPAATELFGLTPDQLALDSGLLLELLHPDDRNDAVDRMLKIYINQTPDNFEYRFIVGKVKALKWIGFRIFPVKDANGVVYRHVGVAEDITERKHAHDALCASLREKDILFKEVHHRVKNNLQLVSSLLSLQAQRILNLEDRERFLDSQRRIQSMTLVHEELYRTDDLSCIDFSYYVEQLARRIEQAFLATVPVDLEMNLEKIYLSVDTAMPCGLILNELISNVYKHAFIGKERGRLFLSTGLQDGQLILKVVDDGVGFPKDFDIAQSDSLGMQVVNELVEQLSAKLTISVDNGTEFKLSFSDASLCLLP
ncbi:response regulator [Halodesulfovibrio sp.]|uniref:response regulator n=1 Tax=Halodesulfovibrio sp. TaxID=1912772 RepID=UPI0025F11B39|nr:response regulator [Halodesulfovibrio sp.]MCT4625710.1 response regulator [Halodesulfovibrio sp.]